MYKISYRAPTRPPTSLPDAHLQPKFHNKIYDQSCCGKDSTTKTNRNLTSVYSSCSLNFDRNCENNLYQENLAQKWIRDDNSIRQHYYDYKSE